jgi:sulfopyruvate decarboxylase TPP-binding subunit
LEKVVIYDVVEKTPALRQIRVRKREAETLGVAQGEVQSGSTSFWLLILYGRGDVIM